ncbi:MAG: protein translocase subunit SecD [Chloroflexota bacterium]|nr:protein translocase subunit SecD [Chloroflexota bacterium]
MKDRSFGALLLVIIVASLALLIALPVDHPDWASNLLFWQPEGFRDLELKQGLDLQGGLQVLLQADSVGEVNPDALESAMLVVENRVNGLGVSEPLVQRQGENRIIVELPGVDDPDQAISTLKGTGLLEFVAAGRQAPPAGMILETDHVGGSVAVGTGGVETGAATLNPETGEPWHTIMTGADLKSAQVGFDNLTSAPIILFELGDSGTEIFRDFTRQHIGEVVSIVMDKQVLSSPVIQNVIDGGGQISGQFTQEEAKGLAVQMQYGALPVPLAVIDTRAVGATLGADSVRSSITAGVIGLFVVLLFMAVYYRVPGLMADVALIIFVLINLSIFKLIPITLTLPGIAGFLLATGTAVDANILIFERMKEELRAGKPLRVAVDAGFDRAWTSILDSNLSTLITAGILFYFGGTFGASSVRGFAVTLIIGILVSMFTAVFVTRVLMKLVFGRRKSEEQFAGKAWLLGV